MTATCERPETSVRNASAAPSGEVRGAITRVIGPTSRLPFQIGAGASACLPRNQSPRKAPHPKSTRAITSTRTKSRMRRALVSGPLGMTTGAAMNDGLGAGC